MNRLLNKWREIPISAKSSIAFIFSSFIIKGIVFLVTPIFTRIMDISQYGGITTYNSWVSIIEIFAILGLTSAGVFNVGLNDNKENRSKYISTCLGLCNISTLIVFGLLFLSKLFLGNDFFINNDLLIVMFIHFLFSPAQIFWITRQRYEYKYKLATTITILSVLIGQAISVIAVLKFPDNATFSKILGNEIGTLLFAIPIYMIILKKGKDYINFKEWKKILVLALPLIPHYLSQHVMASSDKIMISSLVNDSEAAIYGVVSNIGMIGTIFWSAINASLVPHTFEKLNQKKYEDIDKLTKKILLGYMIICILVIFVAPEILRILAPSEYYNGVYAVPPLTFVVFLQALYNLFANIEFYNKKTGGIAKATVCATIVNLILNFIFIPKFSFIAASYTTLVSYIILVILHYRNYLKCQKEKIYDIKYIVTISVFLFIISLICNVLYLNNIVRYVLIGLILIAIIIKRKEIIKIIKSLKKKDEAKER